MYDITSRTSFDNALDWLTRLKENAQEDIVILLIGNKSDLVDQREVTTQEGAAFAQKHQLAFLETSALDANNVELAFTTIINRKFIPLYLYTLCRNIQRNEKEPGWSSGKSTTNALEGSRPFHHQ